MNIGDYKSGRATPFWWKKENRRDVHKHVWSVIEDLDENQSYYNDRYVHFLRMYSNRMASSVFGQDFTAIYETGSVIKLNMIKSCVDTAIAQIASERSRPMHMTVGADMDLRQKASKNDKYILGHFNELQHYIKFLDVFRDAEIWGSGWQKWYVDKRVNKIRTERVPSTEILFDDNECRYGTTRNLFQVKEMDPYVLADEFPKKRAEIENSKVMRQEMYDDRGLSEPVTAVEAWHLPSGPNANDGLHVICISECTLLEEPWIWEMFPFTKFDWHPPMFGLLGLGLVEDLTPIQVEINFLAQKIQRIMNLAASVVWLEKGAQTSKMTNRDLAIQYYKGRPPVIQQLGSITSEFFNHFDRLYARGFEQSGISQLAAQSARPAGLDSGEAIRAYHNIGLQRFKHTGQRVADYHIRCGEQIRRCSEEILASGQDIEIVGADEHSCERIMYSDIALPENSYLVRRHPVALLPDEPAGKIEAMGRILQVMPEHYHAPMIGMLTDIPDLESVVKRATAPYEAAEKMVQRALTTGEYDRPRASMNLQLLHDIATKELNRGYVEGIPEERLEVLQRLLDDTDWLIEQMQPPPMPGQGVPGQTLPGAPPTPQAQALGGGPAPALPPQT